MIMVTVGIPCYNSKYLSKALDSLKIQGIDLVYEILLVDDCSTDDSLSILENYSDLPIRLIKLDKNSGGPGKPRNTVIDNAKGDYILFLDSDDRLTPHAITEIHNFAIATQSDIVGFKMAGENGRKVNTTVLTVTAVDLKPWNSKLFNSLSCQKMYKRSLLIDNNIRFPESLMRAEDQYFSISVYLKAQKISILADRDYYLLSKHDGVHAHHAVVDATVLSEMLNAIHNLILSYPNKERSLNMLAKFVNYQLHIKRDTWQLAKYYSNPDQAFAELKKIYLRLPDISDILNGLTKLRFHLIRDANIGQFINFNKEFETSSFRLDFSQSKPYIYFTSLVGTNHIKQNLVDMLDLKSSISSKSDSLICLRLNPSLRRIKDHLKTAQLVLSTSGSKETYTLAPVVWSLDTLEFYFDLKYLSRLKKSDLEIKAVVQMNHGDMMIKNISIEGKPIKDLKIFNQKLFFSADMIEDNDVEITSDLRREDKALLYWWYSDAHPANFGDVLNPVLFKELTNKQAIHLSKYNNNLNLNEYYFIGSVLENMTSSNAVILGAGFINSDSIPKFKPREIKCVRGPLTRSIFLENGIQCPEVYCDPGLLLKEVYPLNFPKEFNVGFIPHYHDKKIFHNKKLLADGLTSTFIDIEADIFVFIEQVLKCDYIISSSLHGVITAHAYGIPAVWIKLSDKFKGGNFKFDDYYLSISSEKADPWIETSDTLDLKAILKKAKAFDISKNVDQLMKIMKQL